MSLVKLTMEIEKDTKDKLIKKGKLVDRKLGPYLRIILKEHAEAK